MDVRRAVAEVEQELKAVADPNRAIHEKSYQKSDWIFLGANASQVRTIERALAKTCLVQTHSQLIQLFNALWEEPVWEVRTVALMQLVRHARLLTPKDLPMIRELVLQCSGWAFNDSIGCHLLGRMIQLDPRVLDTMDHWAVDQNLWVRRVAMQSLLLTFRKGNLEQWPRFVRYATPLLEEKDFWTRKVIGWVCREVSKKQPDPVYKFLAQNRDRTSGLTLREGAKYLPAEQREALGLKT